MQGRKQETMNLEKLFLELFASSVRQTKLNKQELVLSQEEWSRLLTLSAYHQIIPLRFDWIFSATSGLFIE